MTLQQIRYVLEISRCGSISKAAQKLFIAQPHLSNTLKALEKELGIKIFKREHKGVQITPEGREFLSYAQPLLEQEQRIRELYSQNKIQPIFRLSISSQRFPFVVQSFIQLFQKYDPDEYQITLRETGMYNVIDDIFRKKSDIGIIYLSKTTEQFLLKYLNAKNLRFHEIAMITPCFFFRKSHPMANQETLTIADMENYPFASFEAETATSVVFSEEVLISNFSTVKRNFIVHDRATMVNILTYTDAFSIGTGVLPDGFAGNALISKPVSGHENEIKLGWIENPTTPQNDLMKEFFSLIRESVVVDKNNE